MRTANGIGAAALCLLLAACAPEYSDGSRFGVVTKLSFKGIFWKSWEGELNMGGVKPSADGGVVANVFAFNADPAAVEKLKLAMSKGQRVELVYRQWFLPPWSIEHDHVVIDVRPESGATQ